MSTCARLRRHRPNGSTPRSRRAIQLRGAKATRQRREKGQATFMNRQWEKGRGEVERAVTEAMAVDLGEEQELDMKREVDMKQAIGGCVPPRQVRMWVDGIREFVRCTDPRE